LAKQGQWTNWVNLEKRKLGCRDIWEMEGPIWRDSGKLSHQRHL